MIAWHTNPNFDIQDTYDVVKSAISADDGSDGFSSTLETLYNEAKGFGGEVRPRRLTLTLILTIIVLP